ncbi:MAG: protein translocase subunit SecD, partial [candidate division Zixibacteria bacterium]|nr:protein translocase subunit SecD [candidate division Zixibacteria bacterium]
MQWKHFRILLILTVIFGGFWYVYPSLRISDYGKSWPLRSTLSQGDIDKIAADPLLTEDQKTELRSLGLTKEELESLQNRAVRLGLDLQGGVHIEMEVDKTNLPPEEAVDVVARAMQVINNRVNEFGVSEPIIQQKGDDRIIVELPGLKDINRALSLINQTAQLEFKLLREPVELSPVIDRIEALVTVRDTTSADTGSAALFAGDQENSFRALIDLTEQEFSVPASNITRVEETLARADVNALIPEGTEIRAGTDRQLTNGQRIRTYYYMNSVPELTGAVLADAFPQTGSGADISSVGVAAVGFKTTDDGARIFGQVTGNNIGKRLAIILDGRVFSAPTIQSRIPNGSGEITGINSLEDAKDLAIVLRAGALPAPMKIINKHVVGPSLGADAISGGKLSSLVGLVCVLVFMAVFYRASGLVANLGLMINLILLLGVMAGLQSTLTLPGIAGIILTMGMAVDANILIFERIKEELRVGSKTVRQAIDTGYSNALRTIVDSNITTLITAFALYQFGTGPIKGFAVSLGFGILISMFTAIFITRALYDTITDRWHLEDLSIGKTNFFGNAKFGFMKFGKAAFIITWAIIAAGLVTMAARGGIKWGVDFQGGSLLEIAFNPPVPVQ